MKSDHASEEDWLEFIRRLTHRTDWTGSRTMLIWQYLAMVHATYHRRHTHSPLQGRRRRFGEGRSGLEFVRRRVSPLFPHIILSGFLLPGKEKGVLVFLSCSVPRGG